MNGMSLSHLQRHVIVVLPVPLTTSCDLALCASSFAIGLIPSFLFTSFLLLSFPP